MKPLIDETISRLVNTEFREDPIGGLKYSRATSIISSAYKRHGELLCAGLLERLRECNRLSVWREDEFKLSSQSYDQYRALQIREACLSVELAYGSVDVSIPLDLVVFDRETAVIRSYSIKRGNGSYDGGKRRAMLQDLMRTQMLLADYGRQLGFPAHKAEAKVIFYYGLRSIPAPLSLIGSELDEHFRFEVSNCLEAMNSYFKTRLHEIVETF